jgi:hypothetical protein
MDKIENIRTLLKLNGGEKSNENSAKAIISAMAHLVPDFKQEKVNPDNIKDIIEEIQKQIIPIYDKYFSNEEILGIIEFYKTPIGQAYLSKMGNITTESIEVGSKYGEIIYDKLLELSKGDSQA